MPDPAPPPTWIRTVDHAALAVSVAWLIALLLPGHAVGGRTCPATTPPLAVLLLVGLTALEATLVAVPPRPRLALSIVALVLVLAATLAMVSHGLAHHFHLFQRTTPLVGEQVLPWLLLLSFALAIVQIVGAAILRRRQRAG